VPDLARLMSARQAFVLTAILASMAACSPKTPGSAAVPATAQSPRAAPAPTSPDLGERIYNGNCVACHQQNGQGIANVYPSLTGSPVVLGDPKAFALWVVKGQRPASMPMGRYPTVMLQFGWMKAPDAAALLTYLRTNFGNSAAPVDAATLAGVLGN
jgi:mono/diheme cytochrome c family protein